MARTSDIPLKVTPATKELVRYGAAVFACTQGEFVERAVSQYLKDRKQAILNLVAAQDANASAIAAKHEKTEKDR